jgi:hypothetical protein
VVLLAALAAASPAQARWVDLYAGARAGGITGGGSGGAGQPDFFERSQGPGLGFEVGAKLLIFDVAANFMQLFGSNGSAGTLTQILAGIEIDIPVGRAKLHDGRTRAVFRPGLVGGVAFGTPKPVSPPLSNAQVSDKGLVSEIKLGYEYFLNPFVGVGFEGDLGYHYLLWGQSVNSSQNSSGYQLAGVGTLTFHLGY